MIVDPGFALLAIHWEHAVSSQSVEDARSDPVALRLLPKAVLGNSRGELAADSRGVEINDDRAAHHEQVGAFEAATVVHGDGVGERGPREEEEP